MITIDGSFGEGGGQILRSALALSLVTGKPFEIGGIRSKRSKPGLMRQHLTAVCAALDVGAADADGAEIGSQTLRFSPRSVCAGEFHFSVGTAGSATLVLQTVLPALLLAGKPSTLVLEGGTHNPFAPPVDFLTRVFVPLINLMGPTVEVTPDRPGFYPAGGGRFEVTIKPARKLTGFVLHERGELARCDVRALVSLLPRHIGEREIAVLRKKFPFCQKQGKVEIIESSRGPGNVLLFELGHRARVRCGEALDETRSIIVNELFTGFGERRITAETVAARTVNPARRFLAAEVPVGPHLADQLLLPLAMAGQGSFDTVRPTPHTLTNIEVIKRFLDVDIAITPDGDADRARVDVAPSR